MKKIWGPKFGPEISFFLPFSQVYFISFLFKKDDSLKQCLATSRCKIHEKKLEGPNFGQTAKSDVSY